MKKALFRGLLALALVVSVPGGTALADSGLPKPVARTESGMVRGVATGGVDSFLGIPYAQPPVGPLRWRAPQPAPRWSGVRDTVAYGNRCPATDSSNGPRSETEDCLYLNVHRPANVRPGTRLPVLFWIHGGGLRNGSSNQYDGSLIAERTGTVVVTLNYRLGVFGFLAHSALTREAGQSGDYGFADQQAALRWVNRNVAAFGGDPRRVAVAGESAGGFSVCAHLSAPGSQGLFSAAVIQSGSCPSQTLSEGEASGATFAQALGCADAATVASCLRAVPAARLLDTVPAPPPTFVRGVPVLPGDPDTAVRTGRFARVPLLIGANRDEGRTFAQGFVGATQEAYENFVRSTFAERADEILARYPWPANPDQFTAAYLAGAIFTDAGLAAGIGGCTNLGLTRAFASYTPTFAFEFGHRTGPGLTPQPAGYLWGAGHAAELAYLFPNFDNGTPISPTFTPAERRLAADMVGAWGAFVHSGSPWSAGPASWPSFNRTAQVMSLRAGGTSALLSEEQVSAEHSCDLWTSPGAP